jgi:hypothetical protein
MRQTAQTIEAISRILVFTGMIRRDVRANQPSHRLKQPSLHVVGENVVSSVTNSKPKIISSSGHHRSNQDSVTLDELIAKTSLTSSKS